MGSSNGTYFNGQPLSEERPLQDGDRLTIGETELVFRSEEVSSVLPVQDSPSATVRVELGLTPCPSCGVDLANGTEVCPRCGHDFETDAAAEVPEAGSESEVDEGPEVAEAVPSGVADDPPSDSEESVPTPEIAPPPPLPPVPEPAPAAPSPPAAPVLASDPAPGPDPSAPVSPVDELELSPAPAAAPLAPSPVVSGGTTPEFHPPAGFWIRLAAWVVDAVWINLLLILVSFVLPGKIQGIVSMGLGLALGIGVPVIGWGHFGTTPGKRLFNLWVSTTEGQIGIGFGRAALRWVGYLLSFLLIGIGFVMIGLSTAKRGLHDHLAGTYVCRR